MEADLATLLVGSAFLTYQLAKLIFLGLVFFRFRRHLSFQFDLGSAFHFLAIRMGGNGLEGKAEPEG